MELRNLQRVPEDVSSVEKGGRIAPKRHTRTGWAITKVHWSVVPNYDIASARRKLTTEADRQMELEIDWTASRGKRVYPEFNRQIHVAREKLEWIPELPLRTGWDLPGCPAFIPTQVNHHGQWCLYPPITQPESVSISVYDFGMKVAAHLQETYATPLGMSLDEIEMVHVGDPAGNYRPANSGVKRQETRAAFEVLLHGSRIYLGDDEFGDPVYEEKPGLGWRVVSGAIDHTRRQEAVRSRLTTLLAGGLPAMVICPHAEEVINAFAGGYCYPEYEDGTFGREPLKNQVAHLANAIEYLATRLFVAPTRPHEEEEEEMTMQGFSGASSGSHRRGYR